MHHFHAAKYDIISRNRMSVHNRLYIMYVIRSIRILFIVINNYVFKSNIICVDG